MDEKNFEEIDFLGEFLNLEIEARKDSLNKDKTQLEEELKKYENKIDHTSAKENFEKDKEKVETELGEIDLDVKEFADINLRVEDVNKENKKLVKALKSLNKDKAQLENELKKPHLSKQQIDEFTSDLKQVESEIEDKTNKIETNKNSFKLLQDRMEVLYKKYKIRTKYADEIKQHENEKNKTAGKSETGEEIGEGDNIIDLEGDEYEINNIEEPEDKDIGDINDFYPPAVAEGQEFQPPAVAEGQEFQPPAVPEEQEFYPPAIPEEIGQNLPIRSFWEIYNDTCTEHVGSLAHTFNKLAHMKILPGKNEDTVQKILSVPLTIFKVPMKLIAKIPNGVLRTDKKMQEMRDKIENLSEEEFMVLVDTQREANANGEVVKIDKEHLDQQFMKQYKVNNAYLDVVRERLGKRNNANISNLNSLIQVAQDRITELEEKGKENWTKQEEREYSEYTDLKEKAIEEGKKQKIKLDEFDEGAKKKSSSYRNISGWFLAKFNPDNRDQNAEMAEMAKARREAAERGDRTTASEISGKMQKFAESNTKIKGKGRNVIDRGNYSIESPIEMLDKGQQNKGRLLLSDIAIATSILGLAKQVSNNIANEKIVNEHNEHLQEVNEQNSNIEVTGTAKVSDADGAQQAAEEIAKSNVNSGFNQAERTNLEAHDYTFDAQYRADDSVLHQAATQAAQDVQGAKDGIEALRKSIEYYTKTQKDASNITQNYINGHPQFDYTAYEFGGNADMEAVLDFFTNGTIDYSTNVTGVMTQMLDGLNKGLDPTAVILSTANIIYQAQKDKDKNRFKDLMKVDKTKKGKNVQQEKPIKGTKDEKENEQDEDNLEL